MATKFWHSCCDQVTLEGNSSATENRKSVGISRTSSAPLAVPTKQRREGENYHCHFRQDTGLYGLGPDVDCTKNFKVNADAQSL